jgi:hypothetical protein
MKMAGRDESGSRARTPEWLIERLASGELPDAEAADVRRRLRAEGRDPDETVAALARSNAEIVAAVPAATVAAAVARRAAGTRAGRGAPRGWMFGAAIAAAGALGAALLLARPAPAPGGAGAPEQIGIKGTPAGPGGRLFVYRHHPDGDERLADGARAGRGDLLQLAYRAGGGFGLLLSIDGAGRVTLHWPDAPAGATLAGRLRAAAEERLPSAYELDDAPGFERFFLVTADQPFALAPVLEGARALAARASAARLDPLPISPALRQVSLVLDKTRKEIR